MPAILYLAVCVFFGMQLISYFVPDIRRLFVGISFDSERLSSLPSFLFLIPAGFVVGTLSVTTVTYYLALLIHPFTPTQMHPLYPANILSLCLFTYLGSLLWQKNYVRKSRPLKRGEIQPRTTKLPIFAATPRNIAPIVTALLIMAAGAIYVCFYTFYIKGDRLFVAPSVASDFAPNLALASSFSKGSNFPTQYPHFPGDQIRYHFFFFFLCGNLNLLGLPMDFAFNLPSILAMMSALTLLSLLSALLSGRRLALIVTPLLVFFRSAMNIFYQLYDLLSKQKLSFQAAIRTITKSSEWYVLTDKDDWGLWAINVYANQRHLMLGIAFLLVLVFLYIPYVRRMFLHLAKMKSVSEKLRCFFISRDAWLPRKNDPLRPLHLLLPGLLIAIFAPFFHGSALISAMLILFVMAIFSESRLLYLPVALLAVGSSFLQSYLLSGGSENVVSLAFKPGFTLENPTLSSASQYLLRMSGLTFVLIPLLLVGLLIYQFAAKKNHYRVILVIAFSAPLIFAFLSQVSVEMLANHKFIQISILLYYAIISGLLSYLFFLPVYFRQKRKSRSEESGRNRKIILAPVACIALRALALIVGVGIFLSMIGTGISEWYAFHNRNTHKMSVHLKSDMVEWIDKNTDPQSVFLTPNWYLHTFFLSGRMSYYGWPYYAWSAGHDTQDRMAMYEWILTGCGDDIDLFYAVCEQEDIDYVLFNYELYGYLNGQGEHIFNKEFFESNFTSIASFPEEGDTIIYSVKR